MGQFEEKEGITKNPLINCCYCGTNEDGTFFSLSSAQKTECSPSSYVCDSRTLEGRRDSSELPVVRRVVLYSTMSAQLYLKLTQFPVLSVLDSHPAKQLSIWDRSQYRGTPELHQTQTPREELVLTCVLWFLIVYLCVCVGFLRLGFVFCDDNLNWPSRAEQFPWKQIQSGLWIQLTACILNLVQLAKLCGHWLWTLNASFVRPSN